MGTIEGLTKARMLEIEAASVVSGELDEFGHLILTTHGGTEMDAGDVRPDNYIQATETQIGIAEVATTAEVASGTDDARMVTPLKLRQIRATSAEAVAGTDDTKYMTPLRTRLEKNQVDVFTGIIDPAWSSGIPRVTLDAGQAYTGVVTAVFPAGDPNMVPGAPVLLGIIKGATAWAIYGAYAVRPNFMKQIPLTLVSGNGWFAYGDQLATDIGHEYTDGPALFGAASAAGVNAGAGTPFLTCTSTGIVSLEGLISRSVGPASNQVIATFPISLAPARNVVIAVNGAGSAANIAICTDGTIRYLFGTTSYFSLNGARWRTAASVTAGIATFVPLTLTAPFTAFNGIAWTGEPGSTIHTPGYTIDADKVAVFEGQIAAPAAGAATNVNVSTITGLTAANTIHVPSAYSGTAFGVIRIGASAGAGGSGNILNISTALTANQVFSLANTLWLDSSSPTTPRTGTAFVNSWQAYAGVGYAAPSFAKTPDGLCLAFGLWSTGTIPGTMTRIPPLWRPRFRGIHLAPSNGAAARMDIGQNEQGLVTGMFARGVVPQSGSSAWYSLDGISWSAYS